jgi:streptomycin 6-kinase
VLQHLLNCDRLRADPDALIRRMAGLAGLDEAHLRQWAFARCALQAADWPELADVAARLAPA